jgi:mannose-6-phosphate isomerase-like protein (cupin superfamily)
MTMILAGDYTSQASSLIEYTSPPHFPGSPPHVHEDTPESFYILDGTLGFIIGGETTTAQRSTFVIVPQGVVHTFFNLSAAPVTYLAWFLPAWAEQECRELATPVTVEITWPNRECYRLAALWRQHCSTITGTERIIPRGTG